MASEVVNGPQVPLLVMSEVNKSFHGWTGLHRTTHHALRGVSLELHAGRVLGVIGESGSGKTTLANIIMGLETPDSGTMRFAGHDISLRSARDRRAIRQDIQIVFQDPYSSLNPRLDVEALLQEPLRHVTFASAQERLARCVELLDMVGLPEAALRKFPHQFSGGQRQRIAIARALALSPKVLVCDEAVSALDVSIQAQILELLLRLKRDLQLSIIFIAHGLSAVERVSDDVIVMHNGSIVEQGPAENVLQEPVEPYTQNLVAISRDIVPFKYLY